MSAAAEARNASPQNLAAYANTLFEEALAGPREQLGERLFRMSLTAWENPGSGRSSWRRSGPRPPATRARHSCVTTSPPCSSCGWERW